MYESMALSLDDEAFRVDMGGANDVGSNDVSHSRPPTFEERTKHPAAYISVQMEISKVLTQRRLLGCLHPLSPIDRCSFFS